MTKDLTLTYSSVGGKDLQNLISGETEKRAIIKKFIADNMVDGIDYGRIHIAKNCPDKYNCRLDVHFSKASLFKAGSEKFVSLFKLRPVFRKDDETWLMAGSPNGLFCYVCHLISGPDITVGEGRGAAALSEKPNWTTNNAIKIAQKRAQIDAVLRTGALSDFFTQDLEDLPIIDSTEENKKASQKQIDYIIDLIEKIGHNKEWLIGWVGNLDELSAMRASELIEQMQKKINQDKKVDEELEQVNNIPF